MGKEIPTFDESHNKSGTTTYKNRYDRQKEADDYIKKEELIIQLNWTPAELPNTEEMRKRAEMRQ